MQSFEHLNESVYSSAFLRAYRSIQRGLEPHAEDVIRANAQGWMIQDESRAGSPTRAEVKSMSECDKTAIVQAWLAQTAGWTRVRASYDEGRIYEATSVMMLAEQCEWASLEDVSSLLPVQQGKLHAIGLDLGWGDQNAAYTRDTAHPAAKVYFFNAYRFEHDQN